MAATIFSLQTASTPFEWLLTTPTIRRQHSRLRRLHRWLHRLRPWWRCGQMVPTTIANEIKKSPAIICFFLSFSSVTRFNWRKNPGCDCDCVRHWSLELVPPPKTSRLRKDVVGDDSCRDHKRWTKTRSFESMLLTEQRREGILTASITFCSKVCTWLFCGVVSRGCILQSSAADIGRSDQKSLKFGRWSDWKS